MEPQETKNKKIETLLQKKKRKEFIQFIISCRFFLLLLALTLLIVFIVFRVKMRNLENEYVVQKNQLVNNYELEIDSLNIANIELTVKTFSWAVRSELMRENMDQVNQLMNTFVQEPNIQNVKLIDQEDARIVISTNKKEEGQEIVNKELLSTDSSTTFKDTSLIRIVTPIMGLNKKLGLLVVEVEGFKKLEATGK